jgi:hypothetical protein
LEVYWVAESNTSNYFDIGYEGNTGNYQSNLDPPATLSVPEKAIFFAAAAPLIPLAVLWIKRKEKRRVVGGR